MNLEQALKWVDVNSQGEALTRLRSRQVTKILADTVRCYEKWIESQGVISHTCTWHILNKVCRHCECKHKQERSHIVDVPSGVQIMADITLCTSALCPLKESCYRSQATPNEYHQSYCDFGNHVKFLLNGYKCDQFIAIHALGDCGT